MKKAVSLTLVIFSILVISSCTSNPGNSGSSNILLPNIAGSAGEVLVVIDNFNWKNRAGEIIRKTLEQEYPALTQPEPLFDVTMINPAAFDDLFKMHRTIVQVDVDSEVTEAAVKYAENVWAKPQLYIKIEASNSYALETLIDEKKDQILQNILAYDRKRLQQMYNDSKDQKIKNIVANFNLSLAIPRGYNIDVTTDDFASFSIETPKSSQVIFVYQYPYINEKDLKTDNIIFVRNKFLKKYTQGPSSNSYITTAKIYPPLSYDLVKNGKEIVEVRGLWELENGYMGGPFMSHTSVDKSRNVIVVVEGYAYYPNNKKRNMMRQLEAIIYSARFLNQ